MVKVSQLVRAVLAIVVAGLVAVATAACDFGMPSLPGLGDDEASALPEPTGDASESNPAFPLIHAVGHSFPARGAVIADQVPGWTCGASAGSDYGCVKSTGESFSFADAQGAWAMTPGWDDDNLETENVFVVDAMRPGDFVSFPGGACAATADEELTCASLEYSAGFKLSDDGMRVLTDDEVANFFGEPHTVPTQYISANLDGENVTCVVQPRGGWMTFGCQGSQVDWGWVPETHDAANSVSINTSGDAKMVTMAGNMGQDREGTTWLSEGSYNWLNSADLTYDGSRLRVNYDGYEISVDRSNYSAVKQGSEGAGEELHEEVINVDGTDRYYRVSAPEGWQNRRLPVIYVVHGRGSTPQNMADATEFHKFADAIVVYPQGVDESWAPTFYAADPSGRSDLAFMDQLHNTISSTYSVDQQRVFATGFSNGGGFVRYLSCQRPGRFSTITTAGAAVYESVIDGCAESPINYLSFHGTADDLVEFDGDVREVFGGTFRYLSATDTLLDAAEDSECSQPKPGPKLEKSYVDGYPTSVESIKYNGYCATDLQLISIAGMDHRWPSGENKAGGVDATLESLNFFQVRHTGDSD